MVKCIVKFTMVLLFVTITINIIINIRYRCLFSGRKSTSSKFLLFILLFFYTQKQKRVILYYAGSLYTNEFCYVRNFNGIVREFPYVRYKVLSGAVRYKVLVMAGYHTGSRNECSTNINNNGGKWYWRRLSGEKD